MYKYDIKYIVNRYINCENKFNECKKWVDTHSCYPVNYNNMFGVKVNDMFFYRGKMLAYKDIIQDFFMVSDKNFNNFIKAVVMGGNYENL